MRFSADKLIIFLATGFYSGKVPVAPGTFGTAAGLILCFVFSKMSIAVMMPCLIGFILVSIPIAGKAETLLRRQDPGEIVIDEIAGILITMAGLPFDLVSAVIGFFLFRFLDVLKPFPIRLIDKKMKGGTGIVMDDVAAGIMAHLLLRLILAFWH